MPRTVSAVVERGRERRERMVRRRLDELHGELRMQEKTAAGLIDCRLTVPTKVVGFSP